MAARAVFADLARRFAERQYWYGLKKLLYAGFIYRALKLLPVNVPVNAAAGASGRKRIFLDVSIMVKRDHRTGIQRVVRNLYRAFSANFSDRFEFVPVCATIGKRGFFLAAAEDAADGPRFSAGGEKMAAAPGDVFLGLDYAPAIILSQIRTLKELKRMGVGLYFILHDLIPLRHPEYFPFAYGALERAWLREVAGLGGIVCVSRWVREDLARWLRENGVAFREEDLSWFHHGHDAEDFAAPAEQLPDFPAVPLFLVVGTIEPRKGHAQTLEAFELLWAEGVDAALVFAGRKGWQTDDFCRELKKHPQTGRRLFWLDGCGDGTLGELYGRADAVIMPSEAEGFGLPILEAAARGRPLILRDLPVFREIAGESALYFSGLAAADLAEAVRGWLALRNDGKQPQPSGIAVRGWRQSAARVLEIIEGG